MRQHNIEKISFMGQSFLMAAVVSSWGVDDVVVGSIKQDEYVELDALVWWLAMLNREAPSLYLDVGSYSGLYAMIAAAHRPAHRTVAIEASVLTHGRLVQNILLNDFDLRVVPCHAAVSDRTEIVHLGHAFGALSMASGESLEPDYATDYLEPVASTSLGALLLQAGPERLGTVAATSAGILPVTAIGGMKIDVEGVEIAVLRGAAEVLRRFRPPLIVEILDAEKLASCREILSDAGYLMLAECPHLNYVFCHEADADRLCLSHDQVRASGVPAVGCETILSFSR